MHSKVDILTIEIGSTLTKVIAFNCNSTTATIVGRSFCLTTVDNIMRGLFEALDKLKQTSGVTEGTEIFATSSAAGGLRMTVHGLTRDLTARAAQEASLGAGANIKLLTAGSLTERHKHQIESINPNLIILAGGLDFGEEEQSLKNARIIASVETDAPVIYAGNCVLHDEIRTLFSSSPHMVFIVPNVYPSFNVIDVAPVRQIIQRIFSERLVIASGMEQLRELAQSQIMPVPAACLSATEIIAQDFGDVVVLDVGGATTDVHSVINTSMRGNMDAQIVSARTVEGDLGLFVSAESVWQSILHMSGKPDHLSAVPHTDHEIALSQKLAKAAIETALVRHAGTIIHGIYSADGTMTVRGRDLRTVNAVIGTGGALTHLSGADRILESSKDVFRKYRTESLLPSEKVHCYIDTEYCMAASGSFAAKYPEHALSAIKASILKKSKQLASL